MNDQKAKAGMSKLDKAKEIVRQNYSYGNCGIYSTRNVAGDEMTNIYRDDDGLQIDICYGWGYFEVFGLSDSEFKELARFYNRIKGRTKE